MVNIWLDQTKWLKSDIFNDVNKNVLLQIPIVNS